MADGRAGRATARSATGYQQALPVQPKIASHDGVNRSSGLSAACLGVGLRSQVLGHERRIASNAELHTHAVLTSKLTFSRSSLTCADGSVLAVATICSNRLVLDMNRSAAEARAKKCEYVSTR